MGIVADVIGLLKQSGEGEGDAAPDPTEAQTEQQQTVDESAVVALYDSISATQNAPHPTD